MKTTAFSSGLAGLLVSGLLVLSPGCRPRPDSGDAGRLPPAAVRVQAAENRKHTATEEVVGTVRARLRAGIEAKVSGRIEQMSVAPGQAVNAGDLLVRLDAREIQARLDQAIAQRDQSARDTERLRHLLASNAVSRQEFETVEARYRVAAATVAEMETMVGHTKVAAPFSGVITRKLADVGDLASPGRTLLEMEDPTRLRLEADVPETLINRVQLGAKLPVRVPALENAIEGVVTEIAPIADPGSRTFSARLDLPANAGLRAGQFARLAVPLGEDSTLRVPARAVVQRGQLEMVFVMADRHAQMRIVKTGRRLGDEVELVSGVEAGELVVVEGTAQLRDGQPLEVRP